MSFANASNWNVGTLHATEINHEGTSGLIELKNAACIAAGHRSAERSNPPKCHPETRQAVISNIMSWVNSKNAGVPIMWLNGPAGAGKSAIAQTVAERCHKENRLISSFFFSRTSTSGGRDDGARLIPTISYHLTIAVPDTKEVIMSVFDDNPAILSYSMEDQMKDLVLGPLADVITHVTATEVAVPHEPHQVIIDGLDEYNQLVVARTDATGVSASPIPHLVIIDGLDECNNPLIQSMILNVIAGVRVAEPSVHLRFLIASRPEQAIRKTFESLGDTYVGLTLDESYDPDRDIEIYLRSEFATIKSTHTLARDLSVSSNWPSEQDIKSLVEKSSGHFIYAFTAIKFIGNDRKDPKDRLRTVLNVFGKRSDGSPFAPLDALYTFILSTAIAEAEGYDSIQRIFQVLLYANRGSIEEIDTVQKIAYFLGISKTALQLSLVDLHSIMFVPSYESLVPIRFFHASFGDFLKDSSRSNIFFVAEVKAHITLGNCCLDIVLKQKAKDNDVVPMIMSNLLYYARHNYFRHMKGGDFHEDILSKLRGDDIRFVIHDIISGLPVKQIETVLSIFYEINNFDCLKWPGWKSLVPISEMHRDIINDISPGIDAFFLAKYAQSNVFIYGIIRDLLSISPWNAPSTRRNVDVPPHVQPDLYNCWLASLLECPARGRHLFLSEEKCELLVCDIFRMWKTKKTSHLRCVSEDMAVLKYLLSRVTPSSRFGMFLHNDLPDLVAYLRKALNQYRDYSSPSERIVELMELVTPFIKEYDPLFHGLRYLDDDLSSYHVIERVDVELVTPLIQEYRPDFRRELEKSSFQLKIISVIKTLWDLVGALWARLWTRAPEVYLV